MALPTSFTIRASQSVRMVDHLDCEEDGADVRGDEYALSITYALSPGEHMPTAVAEKAEEVAGLLLLVQRTGRLTRADLSKVGDPEQDLSVNTHKEHHALPGTTAQAPPNPPMSAADPEPTITGPQRMAIEEHFRRLNYGTPEIEGLLSARFCKRRLTDLGAPQAHALLQELRRLSTELPSAKPTFEHPTAKPTFEHPTRPTVSRNGHGPARHRTG